LSDNRAFSNNLREELDFSMAQRKVFYSFHFDSDVMRVQLIRNIGALDENKPVSANRWEEVKRGGNRAIERWIDDNMSGKTCVVVLIGSETSERKWVKYEIEKAWNEGRGLIGVYIHNLKCPRTGTCWKGSNPFAQFNIDGTSMDRIVPCYDPDYLDAYNSIRNNLEDWIEDGIAVRNQY
jgi:hypothetical protein